MGSCWPLSRTRKHWRDREALRMGGGSHIYCRSLPSTSRPCVASQVDPHMCGCVRPALLTVPPRHAAQSSFGRLGARHTEYMNSRRSLRSKGTRASGRKFDESLLELHGNFQNIRMCELWPKTGHTSLAQNVEKCHGLQHKNGLGVTATSNSSMLRDRRTCGPLTISWPVPGQPKTARNEGVRSLRPGQVDHRPSIGQNRYRKLGAPNSLRTFVASVHNPSAKTTSVRRYRLSLATCLAPNRTNHLDIIH